MQSLTETARAKVNLTLRVLARRPDGYHDLDSVVAFADCADTLTFTPGDDLGLTTTGPGADACGGTDDNLVIRAASRRLRPSSNGPAGGPLGWHFRAGGPGAHGASPPPRASRRIAAAVRSPITRSPPGLASTAERLVGRTSRLIADHHGT